MAAALIAWFGLGFLAIGIAAHVSGRRLRREQAERRKFWRQWGM